MFEFPLSSIVNRPIPKTKILEKAKPTAKIRDLLTQQIQQILWYAKLAPETIRLPATQQVPEIQIFRLQLKEKTIDPALLDFLDKSIPQPILWILENHNHQMAHSAAYKRPSEADASQWVLGTRFTSPFVTDSSPVHPLPTALDLGHLYSALLAPLLPLAPRRGEHLQDLIERCEHYLSLNRRISQLQARIQREKHFNRKVELNQHLRALQKELSLHSISPVC